MLEKQGFNFKLGSEGDGDQDSEARAARFRSSRPRAATPEKIEADVVLVAIGRVPYTSGLGLDEAGVKLDKRKRVDVDAHFQTSVAGIYAIGDVIAGPMLAHKAEEEGVARRRAARGAGGPRQLRRHSRA